VLTLGELARDVADGTIDTVVCAFTDMQGRLMGKREHAEFFLEESVDHGIEGCNYLMALDMEMDPQPGYEMASWERGYGDFHMKPDLATLRRIPWLEGTALVLCDVGWEDGSPVVASPRQVLAAQVARARAMGFEPMMGSELEFYLLKETYLEAHEKHYRNLTPSVPYILDYHILATSYDEPFLRTVRNNMQAAGIKVKINTVALKQDNAADLPAMIDWAHGRGLDITLIETMPLGEIEADRTDQYLPLSQVRADLESFWRLEPLEDRTAGPSRYVWVKETAGRLGFITPLSHNFCESCNRVRVTCTGTLFMCLGQDDQADLRAPLRAHPHDDDAVISVIREAMRRKPKGHDFKIERRGEAPALSRTMSMTGG
jgi:hypothetical protein